ncbi:SAM-dependent methyltransferase [Myxococcaceae bacterium GXIMD 01537]
MASEERGGSGEAARPYGQRTVYSEDALAWLAAREVLEGCSVITSLPDVSELSPLSLAEWKQWFTHAAARVMEKVPPDGVAIFYQTDIKKAGAWVDKGYLVSRAAEAVGLELLWHKVVCRRAPGTVTFGRPAYSHLLCFSRGVRVDLGRATPDVLPEAGEVTWTRGMGVQACALSCRFILEHTATRTVVDPFCGHGTALAVANAMGLDAVGVELSRKRAKKARALRLSVPGAVSAGPAPEADGEESEPEP